jgi:hypothetical protein
MPKQPPRIVQISPVATTDPTHEITVFGLDDEGGLWEWDTGMKTAEWLRVCTPVKG